MDAAPKTLKWCQSLHGWHVRGGFAVDSTIACRAFVQALSVAALHKPCRSGKSPHYSHPKFGFMSARELYEALVAAGKVERDPAQERLLARFEALEQRIAAHRLARRSHPVGWLFGSRNHDDTAKGLYIFGEVGRGKTMLMDLFFEASPVVRKRRAHFHEFMADVHERIRVLRHKLKYGEIADDDPIRLAAAEIAEESWLLCFDEFHVTDIADAMILGRLFARLFELGVVLVATSNVAPGELYRGGLNRALFLPFIAMIEKHMDVFQLTARTDFRLEKLAGQNVWHRPADDEAAAALDQAWRRLVGSASGVPQELSVKGRKLRVPRAAMGVARFFFHDLCEQPLAAADYLRIAHEFHTLIVDRIPVMGFEERNAAKRFIILIDTLYDHAVKLVASAAAEPDALYRASDGFEAAEFKRTASRLIEMRSQSYLALPHGRRDSAAGESSEGIVET
jgi:cell division protein ZapE